jgi:hypothetical protein
MKQQLQLFFACVLFFSASAMAAEPTETHITLTGKQDAVLALLKKAIDADIADPQTTPLNGRIGYWVSFKTLVTGRIGLAVTVTPLTKSDDPEPTAFRLEFTAQTERWDGTRNVRSLIEQIEKQAAEQKDVTIIADPTPYRTLFQQSADCYKRLETDTDLADIANKVALAKPDAPALSMLTDDSKPNDRERKAIALWASKRDACFNIRKAVMPFYPGDPKNNVIMEFAEKSSQLLLSLYKGNISFGDFVTQRKAVLLAQTQKLNELATAAK